MIMNETEEYRHKCEVWHLLRLRSIDRCRATRYLKLVEGRRGIEAADKLRSDCRKLWQLGIRA